MFNCLVKVFVRVPKVFPLNNKAQYLRYVTRFIGAPGRIRTLDPQIRSLMLYPAELPTLGLDFFKVIYVWGLGKLMPNEEINCILKWQKLEFYS